MQNDPETPTQSRNGWNTEIRMASLNSTDAPAKKRTATLIWSLLLVLALLAAAYFRFRGIDWGEFQFLHPDERFLVWVGADISPVDSISAYFDTATSTLNPNNRGHGFYVYGTLPMFITRYAVEWVFGHSGFDEMTRVGRPLAALVDLGTVLLVFFAARRLYDRRVGVLAAAFLAATVLHIQQSHFFTMETYLTFFAFLAFYCAVLVVKSGEARAKAAYDTDVSNNPGGRADAASQALHLDQSKTNMFVAVLRDPLFLPSLGFGIALGMAVASKLNAGAVAVALPIAMLLYVLNQPAGRRESAAIRAVIYLFMAAFISLLAFRIFQPYAFSGPGFFGVKPNPLWVDNIRDQRAQSTGEVDFPPAMQWARRPIWFSFQNMALWGLGLPLGILAWAGFLWAGWRLLTRWNRRTPEWTSHALLWSWTALYFIWQSLQLNPTMRYQMPIYPNLAIFAAWTVFGLIDFSKSRLARPRSQPDWAKIGGVAAGALVLLLTLAYAFAFSALYDRPITRIEASRWIYANVPGSGQPAHRGRKRRTKPDPARPL
ncbi:MAG: glycosyltransferase family 39 protein [Anaerolineales bacterium]|nr:glycosyltransferase family 39 protein [Anaerolineales bacterium]